MNLHKQGIFAQTAAHKERFDVVPCFPHGFEDVERAELRERHQVMNTQSSPFVLERTTVCG